MDLPALNKEDVPKVASTLNWKGEKKEKKKEERLKSRTRLARP